MDTHDLLRFHSSQSSPESSPRKLTTASGHMGVTLTLTRNNTLNDTWCQMGRDGPVGNPHRNLITPHLTGNPGTADRVFAVEYCGW